MNHSIYSADRSTHLKIVVVALVAGIAVAGFGISARTSSDDYTQTARVIKAGKPVADHQLEHDGGALTKWNLRIHAALYQPPKVASWILEDPNYPQVDYRKRPLPTGVFFLRDRDFSGRPRRGRGAGGTALDQLAGCRPAAESATPSGDPPSCSTVTA